MICDILCLISFIQHNTFKVHLHCSKYQYLIPISCSVKFFVGIIQHFAYPFISLQTFGLFPPLGNCKQCCYDHLCTHFCLTTVFVFAFCMYTQGGITGSFANSVFNFPGTGKPFSTVASINFLKCSCQDFSDGPVARILLPMQGTRFSPLLGNQIPHAPS